LYKKLIKNEFILIYTNINMKNLEFQLYDWLQDSDKPIEPDEEDEVEQSVETLGNFIIHSFGRCDDGKSVYAKIIGYTPCFYLLLPDKLQNKSKDELDKVIKKLENFVKSDQNRNIYCKINSINFDIKSSLIDMHVIRMKKAEEFDNDKEYYFTKLVFNNATGMTKFRYYFENNDIYVLELKKPVRFKIFEANLPPMLRCFHIRDISGCAWIETSTYKLIEDEFEKESRCDIEIIVDWRNISPIMKDHNAPFRICSFDIECNSIDGEFPQAKREGDRIIQIGATYTYIGESQPYRQAISCLNDTSPINGIIVKSFETERELMLDFLDEINNNDADILTGYNIFFFDEKYMQDRCEHILKITKDMSFMSKLKNYSCEFKEMKLFSSALGENYLRFWNTPGRIHIDLMKDVQKTFTGLSCFKLDFVASTFIRGNIQSYKKLDDDYYELSCNSVQDICVEDYIHLEVIKGFITDNIGNKFFVFSINADEKIIIIKGTFELLNDLDDANLTGTIHWSQAKDDVSPKDIFRLQKGSPDDRAIVAKYCIKDCKLVSLLLNKLEVITKNIEMANVCYVPLSYLFIRGQGIKIFSLTLKEYRIQKYLFPVIKMNKYYNCLRCRKKYMNGWVCPGCKSQKREEIESDNTSYEGAIVFDAIPSVDYEAEVTKDYASLYPSSALQKNMSHETMVTDSQYDNLEGIEYYNAEFKEMDGSIEHRRFAKRNNKLGVIPTILDNLLKERKLIKNKMKHEKDSFKYNILNAKQLAVKVTANSLYGQLGAQTSAICKRDIAACICSTGREMLILAKKYDEEHLPYIINSLKYFYSNNELDKVEHIYNTQVKNRNDDKLINDIQKYVTTNIKKLTFQPIIRYGDTDSIFSCYRFRDNTVLLDEKNAIKIWRNVIRFARELIEPYFKTKERKIFNKLFNTYYSDDKITELKIPESPKCYQIPNNHVIILPLEERMKQFIKEYLEESYFPWLWTLVELVEKNYTNMFDIKLQKWAEHQLTKINVVPQNLLENRTKYLLKPIMEFMKPLFENNYVMPSDETITLFADKLKNSFPFSSEITIDIVPLKKLCKVLMEKTIKERWIFSGDKKEIVTIINKFITDVSNVVPENLDLIIHYITNFIGNNNKMDVIKLSELLIINLNTDTTMGCEFDQYKLNDYTLIFIENYNKKNGKKTLEELMCTFIEKDLNLSFDLYKNNHYNKVITFIKDNMRYEDMSVMSDKIQYVYYWLQPRWDFDEFKNKIYKCDIYEGGSCITDKRSLEHSMMMGKLSGELIKSHLPFPHDCEYEKTYWPFAIIAKKKYVGNKYEFDQNKFKQDFMGIVLKRRDNAAIVKEICGGIINILINNRDPQGAKDFTRKCLTDMFDGKYNIKYFIQSRNIKVKESYKDWKRIAHIVLAEKITSRDPGNAPQSGDRLEYAVIKVPPPTDGRKLLQGDIIETPDFIKKNDLQVDYLFYLTNQIMNPALQFLELVDKNASDIFKEFIDKYTIPKFKKSKVIKPKVIKPKVIKPKVIKPKVIKPKVIKIIKPFNNYVIKIKKNINNINNKTIKINNKIEQLKIHTIGDKIIKKLIKKITKSMILL